jgi:lipopolysaccharide/colanic/teichoic acid biosynthesis glycosyltransferase
VLKVVGSSSTSATRREATASRSAELIALSLLLLASPLLIVLAVAVLYEAGAPVLFRQTRPGRHLRPFELVKFRTLRNRADGDPAGATPGPTGPVGRWLRRSRLDELPQLWNVVRGEMALIGPRPLLVADMPADSERLRERALVPPGLTGWAQVNGGLHLSADQKLAMDLWYIRNRRPWLDLVIIARTVQVAWRGDRVDEAALRLALAEAPEPFTRRGAVVTAGCATAAAS